MYIWQKKEWPQWQCDLQSLAQPLWIVHKKQSRLLGKMDALGFKLREEAHLRILTKEVICTSEIEGEHLNPNTVRSSVARRLGIEIGALAPSDRLVDGVVDMIIDATSHYEKKLTKERLFGWHAALFPTGYSGMTKIKIGSWRDDATGPMQVVSGALGRERVHYEAPPASKLNQEMKIFLTWFEKQSAKLDSILMAGHAHLWFETLHPFGDGNGRIGRALSDMLLARAEKAPCCFYSLSAQIQRERKEYYRMLEYAQHNSLNDTEWLRWFLGCLERAVDHAEETLATILVKARFWNHWSGTALNKRQIQLINQLLDGFEGKLTSSKWAKITKCSPDTGLRDIQELLTHGILEKEAAGGRSTSYQILMSKLERE